MDGPDRLGDIGEEEEDDAQEMKIRFKQPPKLAVASSINPLPNFFDQKNESVA